VHLHDNDGTADSHSALGRGTVEFETFFRLLKAHAPAPIFTIEAHDKEDIETSLERVRNLIGTRLSPPASS
jgi:sugar phosphate isomerase/epimerase